jgi:hypothetical protein
LDLKDNSRMPTPLEPVVPLREPHLLKFRLRQLFLVVTLVSLICASAAITSGPWPWVIALSAIMVAAHVLGNLIGTRPLTTPLDDVAKIPVAKPNLADFGRLVRGFRWFVISGALAGFVLTGTLLNLTIGYRIGWAGWAVGTISGSVMGTWVAFLAVSFTTIARDAWRQAHGREK